MDASRPSASCVRRAVRIMNLTDGRFAFEPLRIGQPRHVKGRIVFVTSLAANVTSAMQGDCAASKAGPHTGR